MGRGERRNSYWITLRMREDIGELKNEALDRTGCRICFGRGLL